MKMMKVESKMAKLIRSLKMIVFNENFQKKTFDMFENLLKKFAAISGVERTKIETKLPESPKNPSSGRRIPWELSFNDKLSDFLCNPICMLHHSF